MSGTTNTRFGRRTAIAILIGAAFAAPSQSTRAEPAASNDLGWRTRCIYRRGKKICWVVR